MGLLDFLTAGGAPQTGNDLGWLSQQSPRNDWLSAAQWGLLADPQAAGADAGEDFSTRLAKHMRRQSPAVPPPALAKARSEDTTWSEGTSPLIQSPGTPPPFGSLAPDVSPAAANQPVRAEPEAPAPAASANVPLPQPRPTVAPEGATAVSLPTDAAAAPPAASVAPPARAPMPTAPPAPDPGDRLSAAFHGFANSQGRGLLGAISNGVQGLATGRRTDPAGIQNQTERALVTRGLPPDVARAAASNPAILNQIIPQIFGAKQLQHVTIKDSLGNEIPLAFNPSTGQYHSANVAGAAGTSAVSSMPVEIDPKTGRDEKFLSALGPIDKAAVEGLLRGDENAQGRNMQKYLPYAARAAPGFSQQDYFTRLAARKDITSGAGAKELTAYDTMARHAAKLHKLVDEMDPNAWTNFLPAITAPVRRAVLGQIDPKYQDLMGRFDNLAGGLAAERAKALKGGNVAEADVNEGRAILSNAKKSKAGVHGAIDEMFDMVNARIAAKEDAYKRAMRGTSDYQEFMSPAAYKLYQKYLGAEQATPASAAPPRTGLGATEPSAAAPSITQPAPGWTVQRRQQ